MYINNFSLSQMWNFDHTEILTAAYRHENMTLNELDDCSRYCSTDIILV